MRVKFYWLVSLILVLVFSSSCSKKETEVSNTYSSAEIIDVMNGSNDKAIGQMSLLKMDSKDVTDEFIKDWYFNYVNKNNFNWAVILYTDKNDNIGVFANNGFISKNIKLSQESDGTYTNKEETSETINYQIKNNELVEIE